LYYVAADCASRLGRAADAAQYAAKAKAASPDYVFPFRLEHEGVLTRAIARDPGDARAPYYLGNLLMDVQPERAVAAWESAARLEPTFAMVHRNLGWAAARAGTDLRHAIRYYERAVAADASEPVYFYELDRLYEAANTPAAARLTLLEAHKDTIAARDDATARLVGLYVLQGRYDDALNILRGRTFHTWEGGTRFLVHSQYVDAHLRRGRERLAAGRHAEALADFEAALEYPPNLGAGRPERGGRAGEALYLAGLAHEALGRASAARQAWLRAAADVPSVAAPGGREARPPQYFAARALERLGDTARARAIFGALVSTGRRELSAAPPQDFFAKFGERPAGASRQADAHYLLGLGLRGLGREQEAREAFTRALERNVNHLGAMTAMRDPRADSRGSLFRPGGSQRPRQE
jgi:tetratricopeptide (TPR) repeat protein